jgi:hypothetical protein
MTRRRLVLASAFAVFALGAAWWLLSDGLSAEERRLVGTWELTSEEPRHSGAWTFRADRSFVLHQSGPLMGRASRVQSWTRSGRWAACNGVITLDDQILVQRLTRPLYRLIGRPVVEASLAEPESMTADAIVFLNSGGTRAVWQKADSE